MPAALGGSVGAAIAAYAQQSMHDGDPKKPLVVATAPVVAIVARWATEHVQGWWKGWAREMRMRMELAQARRTLRANIDDPSTTPTARRTYTEQLRKLNDLEVSHRVDKVHRLFGRDDLLP